jgi:pyruvate kinase
MNVPGVTIDMPSLVPADYAQLDGAADSALINFVGLSFVRDRRDIDFLRAELDRRHIKAQIVAKIETQAALDNLEEIVAASDAVMVARGDLGVEMPYEELTFWQNRIIDLCHNAAKPVITATQMLKSMTEQPRPTRAEVSDVAHAIYDGTDAIMLSEETTIGKYPVKAVQTQAKIATFNEPYANTELFFPHPEDVQQAITNSVVELVETSGLGISHIMTFSISGRSVRLVARLHPNVPIIAVTPDERVCNEMSVVYGVTPVLVDETISNDLSATLKQLQTMELLHDGDLVAAIHGQTTQTGGTNTISVVKV